jgi:carbamoylphosphate synthase small subunit
MEVVEARIIELRGNKVILDSDLAALYGVETRTLNQAVRRNAQRLPADFVFRITAEEEAGLRSQSVISNAGRGGRRYLPLAFTEHGALMVASILNSREAIEMSVFIVRAVARLRSIYASHRELTRRLDELDTKVSRHDVELRSIVQAIRRLAVPSAPERHPIGFTSSDP